MIILIQWIPFAPISLFFLPIKAVFAFFSSPSSRKKEDSPYFVVLLEAFWAFGAFLRPANERRAVQPAQSCPPAGEPSSSTGGLRH